MRYVKLTEVEKITLEEGFKNHSNRFFRNRCQCLLSSDRGVSVKQLALIYGTRTRTIYTWFDRWGSMGLTGLRNLPGQGCKPKLDSENPVLVAKALKAVKNDPIQLAFAAEQLSQELGYEVSKSMLKRLVKKKI